MVVNFINYVDKNCPYCGRLLKTTSAYTQHVRQCKQNPESEWYKTHQKICPKCGKDFVGNRTYCSRSCANGHIESAEQIEKMKRTLAHTILTKGIHYRPLKNKERFIKEKVKKEKRFCEGCKKEISWKNKYPYCDSCRRKYVPYSEEARKKQSEAMKGKPRWHIHRNQTSFAEDFWIKVLKNNNIPFKREYPVKKDDNIHCYFLDFFIEKNNKKIDLEIDGKQHQYRVEQDKIRDLFLSNKGYLVYRIPFNNIRSVKGKEEMKNKIDKFLEFYNAL